MPVSYATDIRPLFLDRDVQAMKQYGSFDLSVHEDVVANADGILERLRDGSMPCTAPWPADHIDRFSRWITDGKLP